MKLISIPANPVPDDVVTDAIQTPDGVNLRFARWAPPPGRKGTVLVLQGRAEFIEKYFETVRDLRARGFAVVTFDWRGQGLSDRALSNRHKGYVRSFSNYITDLEAVMEQVVLPDCPPPIFALAHSMGGAVVIRACHDGSRWFERVVLSAPMVALPSGRLTQVAGPLARLMRLLGIGGAYVPTGDSAATGTESFIGNVLTSDPSVCAERGGARAGTALGLGAPTVAWADVALRQMNNSRIPPMRRASASQSDGAAGRDEAFQRRPLRRSGKICLRAGTSFLLAPARDSGTGSLPRQFWAAFDAFVPAPAF
jgi:lysophospholipase